MSLFPAIRPLGAGKVFAADPADPQWIAKATAIERAKWADAAARRCVLVPEPYGPDAPGVH